jgi:protein-S-isoprenylcysteine O-methyltransferase Ste14
MEGRGHPIVLVLGACSILVYHWIIVGEERFLATTFGAPYAEYRGRVRRYL